MKFLTIEKIVYFFFCLSGVGLAKVNESECQQYLLDAYNCRIVTSRLKTGSKPLV